MTEECQLVVGIVEKTKAKTSDGQGGISTFIGDSFTDESEERAEK